jgi:hypothetical protein
VGAAVEALPVGGFGEPEVGSAVDHEDVVAEVLGDGGRLPMRQRKDHHVVTGERLHRGGGDSPIVQRHEVSVVLAERAACAGASGQGADLHLRVAHQQAQQLTPGISAGAGNGDA